MFNNKKPNILRHPYATLMIVGLAAAGAISIGEKIKSFCSSKTKCLEGMMHSMKKDTMSNMSQ